MRDDIALQLQLSVLTSQADEFLSLGRRQDEIGRRRLGLAAAPTAISPCDPVLDGLARRLELAGEVGRIDQRTGTIPACQLLLGHTKLESTVRYLGIAVDDALILSDQTEIRANRCGRIAAANRSDERAA